MVPRYIDAEKLEKDGWSASRTYQQDVKTMVYETKKMTDFPTADVVEVKHGEWKQGCCLECGYDWGKDAPITSVPNFCPNCGVKMDGKERG